MLSVAITKHSQKAEQKTKGMRFKEVVKFVG
jgi:hypothetical protein